MHSISIDAAAATTAHTRPSKLRTYYPDLSKRVAEYIKTVRGLPWSKWTGDARWWAWRNRIGLAKSFAFALTMFTIFYIWYIANAGTLDTIPPTSTSADHMSHNEVIRGVDIIGATIATRQYMTYESVDSRIFRPCQTISTDDFASGLVTLTQNTVKDTAHIDMIGSTAYTAPKTDTDTYVDHTVVKLEDIRTVNEALLADLVESIPADQLDDMTLMMIPKFWNVTTPHTAAILDSTAFNPCVLSVRLPGGMVITLFNPIPTNEIYAITEERYARKEPIDIIPGAEDVFPFWPRTTALYQTLRLRYNKWPGLAYDTPTITDFTGMNAFILQIYIQYLYAETLFEDMLTSQ